MARTADSSPMARWILVLVTFLSSMMAIGDPFDKNTCATWNASDLDIYIDKVLLGNGQKRSVSILVDLAEVKKNCPKKLLALKGSGCLDRIYGYYGQTMELSGGGMFSAVMNDDEYYASQPAEKMALPRELATTNRGLPENWREIAKEKGWLWVRFHSDTGNQQRLVFIIPKDGYKQFILFRSSSGTSNMEFTSIQMQTIEYERDGKVFEKPKIHFRAWNFDGPNKLPSLAVEGDRCLSCHISGPRLVVPSKAGKFPAEFGGVKDLEEFNSKLPTDLIFDYSMYYNLRYFPTHLQIGKEDACITCHDSKKRHSFAFALTELGFLRFDSFDRKIVREKSMPKHPLWDLDDKERKEMVERLKSEYYSELKKWLTEKKCRSAEPEAEKPRKAESPSEIK